MRVFFKSKFGTDLNVNLFDYLNFISNALVMVVYRIFSSTANVTILIFFASGNDFVSLQAVTKSAPTNQPAVFLQSMQAVLLAYRTLIRKMFYGTFKMLSLFPRRKYVFFKIFSGETKAN